MRRELTVHMKARKTPHPLTKAREALLVNSNCPSPTYSQTVRQYDSPTPETQALGDLNPKP